MTEPAEVVGLIVKRMGVLLAGHPAEIQGAVLADLLAIYLAGHHIHGSQVRTDALRERLLEMHVGAVRELIPVNAEQIHGGRPKEGSRR